MTPTDKLRKRIQLHSRRYSLHTKHAHQRRNEILNKVPEHEREAMRGLLGQFVDYVRFSDSAQRKIYDLQQELKENQ